MELLFQYFFNITIFVEPVTFCLNLNDALLLSATEKLAIASLASKEGLFL